MQEIRPAVIDGFNEYLQAQKAAPGTAIFTLATFAQKQDFKVVLGGVEAKDFPDLHADTYNPNGGGTALYDGILKLIEEVETLEAGWTLKLGERPPVLFIIMTDGRENASQPITRAQVFEKIQGKSEGSDGWQFVYLGANQDAYAEGASMGVQQGATKNFAATYGGTTRGMASVSASSLAYRGARAGGQTVTHFFQDEDDADTSS